jgi:hypothetical protein
MARKKITIGGLKDIIIYDDTISSNAIDTDGIISAAGIVPSGGASGSFVEVAAIQAGGTGPVGFQYRTRTITVSSGIITSIGSLSSWVDV